MRLPAIRACFLLFPLLAGTPRPTRRVGPAPPTAADVTSTIRTFRQAVAAGDSARARAAFTPSAWILDETERPLHRRPVGQAGCRGWCRPAPPLRAYQLEVLMDSAAALAVETYRAAGGVFPTRRRHLHEYTVVSVLTRQSGQWRISSQTEYRQRAK